MNNPTPALPTQNRYGFTLVPCYRCGGTGHYSYNQMDGTRCWGCQGRKVVVKRGKVKKAWEAFLADAIESRKGYVRDLKVGDLAAFDSRQPLRPIDAIERTERELNTMTNGKWNTVSGWAVTIGTRTYMSDDDDMMIFVRARHTVDVNDYLKQAGLAPQEGN